jgi:hypothetical protein
MKTLMCNEHQNGLDAAAARARVGVHAAFAISTSWDFSTKPYGYQRPSGASPG